MGSSCTRGLAHNIRELWSYFALSGLLFLNIGIVMVVYALKRATPYPVVLEVSGLGLIIMGVLFTLTSWYVHRQQRRKKPICACSSFCCKTPHDVASEDSRLTSQNKNLQSNFYISRKNPPDMNKVKKTGNTPQHTIKMFSTPEFQKYAEYMERDTAGVEVNRTGRCKVDALRQKKHVHPQLPKGMSQIAILVNTVSLSLHTEQYHKCPSLLLETTQGESQCNARNSVALIHPERPPCLPACDSV